MGLYTPRFPSVTRGGDAPTLRSASLERRAPLRAPRRVASARARAASEALLADLGEVCECGVRRTLPTRDLE